MTRVDALRALLLEAYRIGFNASAEGWNGEYPGNHETDDDWLSDRDKSLAALTAAGATTNSADSDPAP